MRLSTLALSALVLSLPLAASAQPAPQDQARGGGLRGFLSPEEREMYRQQNPAPGGDSLTRDQRRAWLQQMRQQFAAMSDADKAKLKTELDAKWNALPPAEQQAIEQKIADRRARWQQRRTGEQNHQSPDQ